MTAEEKAALIQLMGSAYGIAHQLDSNIMGESSNLKRGMSQQLKKQLEEVVTIVPDNNLTTIDNNLPAVRPHPQVDIVTAPTAVENMRVTVTQPPNYSIPPLQSLNVSPDSLAKIANSFEKLVDAVIKFLDRVTPENLANSSKMDLPNEETSDS